MAKMRQGEESLTEISASFHPSCGEANKNNASVDVEPYLRLRAFAHRHRQDRHGRLGLPPAGQHHGREVTLLFVAHREAILGQAHRMYCEVVDATFVSLLVDTGQPAQWRRVSPVSNR